MKRYVFLFMLLTLIASTVYAGLHTRSGTVYVQNGQYEEAVRELKLAIEEDPKDDKAHFMIGVAYSNLDMKGQQLMDSVATVQLAYEHFVKAMELQPKKARDCRNNIQSNYARHYKAGQVAFNQKNITLAAHEFDLATKADPNEASAYYNLAVSYSRLAQADKAYYQKTLDAADRVLSLVEPSDPNYERSLELVGYQLVYLDRPDEAVVKMKTLVDADPEKYTVVEEMGNNLAESQRWAGAAAFLKLAAETRASLGADDAKLLAKIGDCEFELREDPPGPHLDEAIAYYEKSLTINPDDTDVVYDVMSAYYVKKDWAGASLWGEKYVSLNPSNPKAWKILASSYHEMGDDAKASDALTRASTLGGE